ncbi:hypothetical protein [Mycobacterium kubicae]|uniref:hypothetical protein n=1 Tax=Mycobacterium kubicae TaxID=120959 RepID=UPI000AB677F9|nr:hypothetical protein [Mycobacterium kubicae]
MGRPQKSNVLRANATALGDLAKPLRDAATSLLQSAWRVHQNVHDFKWEGQAKNAAEGRADREYFQDRAVAAGYEDLADAYEDGKSAMQPMIEHLKSKVQGLEADDFAVSEDWVVTDTYDYAAARKLAKLMGLDDSDINTFQAQRAKRAADETANLQQLADDLGTADASTANAINEAKAALGATTDPNGPQIVLVDNDTQLAPTINADATPPVFESSGDDLDATIPNTGINIGGDGAHHHPYLNGGPNPLESNVGPDARPIPTGTAAGPNGQQLAFYSTPPYHLPPGSNTPNNGYVTPNSVIVDLQNPSTVIGRAPVAQASGAYDRRSNTMFVVGNPGDGHGIGRELWQSDPIDPHNPNAWANNWHKVGEVLPGNRENQITALQGGGFMLTGSTDDGPISAVAAATPEGLVGQTRGIPVVTNLPDGGVPGVYGPTVVSDHFDPATGRDTIQLRVSQYAPPGSPPDVYDPQTFTSTFTVSQPPPVTPPQQ